MSKPFGAGTHGAIVVGAIVIYLLAGAWAAFATWWILFILLCLIGWVADEIRDRRDHDRLRPSRSTGLGLRGNKPVTGRGWM